MSDEQTSGLNDWFKLTTDEKRLGLEGLDYDEYIKRRSTLSETDQRVLDDDFKTITRNFAEEHFRLFKTVVLSWTHDPRVSRIIADPKLKELPRNQLPGPLLHVCAHLGEEIGKRTAAGEVVPQAVLLGIGVLMGWYARTAGARIGVQDHVAAGGRIGREAKIDSALQEQLWLWKRDGVSQNEMVRRLASRGVTVTKKAVRGAIKREDTKRRGLSQR